MDYAQKHREKQVRDLTEAARACSRVPREQREPEILSLAQECEKPEDAYFLIPALIKANSVNRGAAVTVLVNKYFQVHAEKKRFESALKNELTRYETKHSFADDWKSGLIKTDTGSPKPVLANAIHALRAAPHWHGVLAYDEFAMRTVIQREFPGGDREAGFWSDRDDISTANWLQHEGILVKPDVVSQAVELVSKDHTFHPVKQYLRSLTWDKTSRIGNWLQDYLGAVIEHPENETERQQGEHYLSYAGACWLISAVARIMQPGAKVDTSLILEGVQGARKSTALKILGGEWFTDEIADLGSKDAAMQTRGVWIIEIAELDSMSRTEVSNVKAFLSRTIDRFRPPYGRRLIESPRQCVFAGTVNHSQYLKDETGARRFWPVQCGEIDTERLIQDRDQLWAEAYALFLDDTPWWFEAETTQAAEKEQRKRYSEDPWDATISEWIGNASLMGDGSISVAEIMKHALGIEVSRRNQIEANRVARFLKANGWSHFQRRTGKDREWRYRRG